MPKICRRSPSFRDSPPRQLWRARALPCALEKFHDHREAEQVKNRRAQARLTLAADVATDGGRNADGMTTWTQEQGTGLEMIGISGGNPAAALS
jgi:hypothetical protein